MNDQVPPFDPGIRDQLARRSAGRVPEGLLEEIGAALNAVPVEKPRRVSRRRIMWRGPRTLAAAACLVLVAVMAVGLIGLPALNGPAAPTPPAGYPADRALTTSELAAVMAGPALKVNAALVASVTIDSATDVCPMNRYPSIGVVEGMGGQVCVMGATVAAEFAAPKTTGTFAFRYLGPGVLGLLGEITPASDSRLAFKAADAWPATGTTFLVQGWLGSNDTPCPAITYVPGDPLDPLTACDSSWLADYVDAAGSPLAEDPSAAQQPDPIRILHAAEAYGARVYDSIPTNTPVHGVYVVRLETSTIACGGFSSCAMAHVLAKLADISVPAPSASPVTPASPPYPTDRALTTAELGRVIDAGALKQYDSVVADATVAAAPSGACPGNATGVAGFAPGLAGIVAGIDPPVCVYATTGTTVKPGLLVLRVLGPSQLGYMATVSPGPDRLAYSATDQWPDGFSLVEGWLDTDSRSCGKGSLPGYGGPQPLFPVYSSMCHAALSDAAVISQPYPTSASSEALPAGPPGGVPIPPYPIPGDGQSVDAAPYFELPTFNVTSGSVHGVFLVDRYPRCSDFTPTDCENFIVLVRLADVTIPPAPTGSPQSPVIGASPSQPAAADPSIRIFTAPQLEAALAGRELAANDTIVASVTIDEKACLAHPEVRGGVVESLASQVCVQGDAPTLPKIEGTFAFRYIGPGLLENLGPLDSASPGRLLFLVADNWPSGITQSHTFLATGCLVQDVTGTSMVETAGHFPPAGSTFSKNVIVDPDAGIDRSVGACGVFVVSSEWTTLPASSGNPTGDGFTFHVRAQASDLVLIAPTPTPTAG